MNFIRPSHSSKEAEDEPKAGRRPKDLAMDDAISKVLQPEEWKVRLGDRHRPCETIAPPKEDYGYFIPRIGQEVRKNEVPVKASLTRPKADPAVEEAIRKQDELRKEKEMKERRKVAERDNNEEVAKEDLDDDTLQNIDFIYDCADEPGDCGNLLAYSIVLGITSMFVCITHFIYSIGISKYGPFLPPESSPRSLYWQRYMEPAMLLVQWFLWIIGAAVLTMPNDSNLDLMSGENMTIGMNMTSGMNTTSGMNMTSGMNTTSLETHDLGDVNIETQALEALLESSKVPYLTLSTGWLMIWLNCAVTTAMLKPVFTPCLDWMQRKSEMTEKCGAPGGPTATIMLSLGLLSMAVLWPASDLCSQEIQMDAENCDSRVSWAVTCSLFSLIFCGIILLFGNFLAHVHDCVLWILSLCLVFWWWMGVTVFCVTVPFGSGYPASAFMGAWGAFLMSGVWSAHIFGFIFVKDSPMNPDNQR